MPYYHVIGRWQGFSMSKIGYEILQRIEDWIGRHDLVSDGQTVIIALSGGCDSVFLLLVLKQLSVAHRIKLRAVHINHRLRGKQSDMDEEFVKSLCAKWHVPLALYSEDVEKLSKQCGLGIEETARNLRMRIFEQEANRYSGVVATAHTADDAVETLLFNLLRGTGIRGLAGIPPRQKSIIRPILVVWRKEIEEILLSLGLSWCEDSSNKDKRFTRNLIRHELVPKIVEIFGEDAIRHIFGASRMLQRTRYALEDCFRMRYQNALIGQCRDLLMFRADIALSDVFSFGELLRQALPQIGLGLKRFSFDNVERIYELLTHNVGEFSCPVFGGAIAVRKGNWILICNHVPFQTDSRRLANGEELILPDNLGILKFDVIQGVSRTKSDDRCVAYLKYDGEQVWVKPFRSDFLFHPLGGVSQKLSSFLKNRNVSKVFRQALPLIFIGKKLAWVAGVEISEQFKITEATEKAIKITWKGEFPEMFSNAMFLSRKLK